MLKPIKNDADHAVALEHLVVLMTLTPHSDSVQLLGVLIETYERERFPMKYPTARAAIRFRMEQQGLRQKDLIPIIGARSRVSEVLSGKRPLTLAMIRRLNEQLGIPAECLIR